MSTHENPSTPPAGAPPTIGELVSKVSEQFSTLIRGEIELAQTNLKAKATRMGAGGGMFAAAGVLALYALGILLLAAVWGISVWLPLWASALIVGVVLLIIVAVLALVGKKQFDAAKQFEVDPKTGLMMDVDAAKKGIQL